MLAGKVVTATLNRDDKHYFRFVPAHNETYVFFSRGGNRTWAELYNERFDRIADDRSAGEEGNFRIAARLTAGQTYYVMVRGQPGPYALHVEGPEGGTTSDDHGFSSWSSTAVTVGGITTGAIDVPNDQDYFKFKAGQTATYVVFTRGGNRTYGELYNERFDRIADDRSAGEEGNFRIAARLTAGQTYYVMVRGQVGPYALHIEGPEGATASDDHGFSSWSATPVKVGSATPGAVNMPNDQDYFKFKPGQTATYVMFTRGGNRTYGELYNEYFDRVAQDNNAGEEGNFRIAARLTAGQTYYVMVRGQPGAYAFHVEGPEGGTASDDHGFSSWSATPVKVGATTPGDIDIPNDQDYFKFKPGQSATYVMFTRGGNRTFGELRNERFELLAQDGNAGEEGNFRIAARLIAGQTYYVQVRGQPGSYVFHLEGPEGSTQSDDHGFSSWSATSVKVGSKTVGVIDVPNDQDYFKFKAGQTATYVVFTRGGNRTYGELYNERFDRIAQDSNAGGEGNFRISARLTEGQTYYLMVRGEPGPYTLHVDGPEDKYSAAEVKVATEVSATSEAAALQDYKGFPAGYCTNYAARVFDSFAPIPKQNWRGNADQWIMAAGKAGWRTSADQNAAQEGAIAVWDGGGFGHVAIVKNIEKDASGSVLAIEVSEMNWGRLTDAANAVTEDFGKVNMRRIATKSLSRSGGSYHFLGYIFPVLTRD